MSTELKDTEQTVSNLPEGWYPASSEDLKEILRTYLRAVSDRQLPQETLADLESSVLLVNRKYGWVALSRIIKGVSGFVHGAKWDGVSADLGPEFVKVCRWAMRQGNLLVLIAMIPEHNKGARRVVESAGFFQTGFIPLLDTYDQLPRNVEVWAFRGDVTEEG
ncbi:MAG: hypothetical protein D6812_02140 [Deltaproteobacteria bacterium]|nr:MAG: hypothetical protein D6812_02140 [Deltaproteobacteria bacterium]